MLKTDRKWQILITVCIGIFIATLDGSILSIANPTIASDFGVSMKEVQWVVTSYMLVITSSLILLGKLGDRMGSIKVYSLGFLVFTVGSLFCSLSPSLLFLIASRVFQGVGASMMMATGMGIVSNAFPDNERGKALGLTGSVVGIGNATGPSLGGFLLVHYNWPIIFLINIPIGILGFWLARKLAGSEEVSNSQQGHDLPGTVAFAIAVTMIIISLSGGDTINPGLFAAGILALIIFVFIEKQAPSPILDFSLFKIKNFVIGIIMGFAAYCSQNFALFLMPFYLENLLRFSPGYSGLLMTIPPIIMIVVSPLSGNLSDKIGSAKLTSVAFLLMTTAHLFFSSLTEDSNLLTICVGLALLGMGMGSFGSPNNNSIMGSIPKNSVGYAGGFVSTVRNFSFALGIAASVSIFSYFFTRSLASASFAHAYVEANTMVYRTAAVITLIGLLISLSTSRSRQIASSEEK
ncbi:MAG: MFS transporter [Syntrophomonadaceae bacterium]